MKVEITNQEDMIDAADLLLSPSRLEGMDDFDRYCYVRDTLKIINTLPLKNRENFSLQLEVHGIGVKHPVWNKEESYEEA